MARIESPPEIVSPPPTVGPVGSGRIQTGVSSNAPTDTASQADSPRPRHHRRLRRGCTMRTGPITLEEVALEMREQAYGCRPTLVAPKPQLYTAADLRFMEFEPLSFVIPGYLVEGLVRLVGKPKLGKSWMALDWLLAVARRGTCLRHHQGRRGRHFIYGVRG